MRLLIFSSNDHIQQSAAAIATACHAARRGQRVLLASTGPNHRIGTLIGQSLGPRPLELEPNLAAIELSAHEEVGNRWEQTRPTLRSGIAARLRDVGEDELPAFPGIDAIGALLVADRARATGRFDLLIFDGPAPFPLVRALSLPDALRWLLRLIFGIDRGPGRSRTSVETAMIPASLIAPTAVAPLQDLRIELENQRARVDASTGARVRLVLKPEELHLSEYREILTGLGFYGVAADEIQVNGAPESIDDATRHEFSPAAFTGRPLLRQIKLETTPATRDDWALRGASMYRDKNIFDDHAPPDETAPSDREMRLHMPFLNAKALDIAVASEEVVVRIEQWRRHILLPGMVDGGKLRAKVEGETLRLWVE